VATPAPGWFPDPFDPTRLRWWDGRQWTTDLHPAARRPGLAPPIQPPRAPGPPRRLTRGATVALATAGVLLVGTATATAAGVLALGASPAPTTTSADAGDPVAAPEPVTEAPESPTASAPASATATPSPTATATPRPSPASKPAVALVAVVGVTDGDTIKVRIGGTTERVRVIGIDTPELRGDECYAQQAASRMQSLVQGKSVRLVRDPSQDDRDRYGRLLRHVALTDGRQVAKVLIAGGFGEEYTYDEPYAGRAAYRAAEKAAREAGRGIWSSGCRAPVEAAPVAPTTCLIKGNIADDGEKIYHLPGQRFYDVTRISESRGERWFCTEGQARDAGWRASKA
jgi:micrococcal nuclease